MWAPKTDDLSLTLGGKLEDAEPVVYMLWSLCNCAVRRGSGGMFSFLSELMITMDVEA